MYYTKLLQLVSYGEKNAEKLIFLHFFVLGRTILNQPATHHHKSNNTHHHHCNEQKTKDMFKLGKDR